MEKPVAAASEALAPLTARAAAEPGRVIRVGYDLRFTPILAAARRLIADGTLGQVQLARAEVGQYLPDWRPQDDYRAAVSARADLGGGAILELSHEIDLALWLFGAPTGVTAVADRVSDLEIDVEDCATLALDYAAPRRSVIVQMDFLQRAARRSLLVIGSEASLEVDLIAETALLQRPGAEPEPVAAPALEDGVDGFLRQFDALFAETLEGYAARYRPIAAGCRLDEAAEALRVASAAKRARPPRRAACRWIEGAPLMSIATPLGLTGFIFARGGSKGVPRKNLRMVGGKPLIAWAIDCALSSRHIDRVVVSTDDAEIAETSRACGAETPFSRPAELASDNVSELLAWRHAIETMRAMDDGVALDPFVSVPAVAPLRAPQDVDASIEEFLRLRAAGASPDLVLSVTPAHRSPYFNMVVEGPDGWVRLAARGEDDAPVRRQDAPQMFDIATCVYTADPEFILRTNALLDGRVGRVVVPQERALDIDTEFDLEVANLLLSKRR